MRTMVEYLDDDCKLSNPKLQILWNHDIDSDIYICVHSDETISESIRFCASGGASSRVPGLRHHLIEAFKLIAEKMYNEDFSKEAMSEKKKEEKEMEAIKEEKIRQERMEVSRQKKQEEQPEQKKKEESKIKRICPMISSNVGGLFDCVGEICGWWDGEDERCSVRVIAAAVDELAYTEKEDDEDEDEDEKDKENEDVNEDDDFEVTESNEPEETDVDEDSHKEHDENVSGTL